MMRLPSRKAPPPIASWSKSIPALVPPIPMVSVFVSARWTLPSNVMRPGELPGLRSDSKKTSPVPVNAPVPENEPKKTVAEPAVVLISVPLWMIACNRTFSE